MPNDDDYVEEEVENSKNKPLIINTLKKKKKARIRKFIFNYVAFP